ncbi:MAG: FAD-dependent oxidoreductase [Actinobacteria bacterium]|nr:FAD-dependent oxidoreductase [Actinomycetota bacterium]
MSLAVRARVRTRVIAVDRRALLQLAMVTLAATALPACTGGDTTGRKVLIVGAGMAGLAAARALRNEGIEVEVIEGNDRVGGRIWTSFQWPDVPIDLGASWIHGLKGNPITDLAKEAGATLATTSYDSSVAFGSDGRALSAKEQREVAAMGRRVAAALRKAQRADSDQSVRSAVESGLDWQSLTPYQRRLARFIMISTIEAEYSGSTDDTSAYWFDSVGEFAGEDAVLLQGYSVVIDALAEGVPIVTGQPVTEITATSDTVTVTTASGSFTGDAVIVTLPLGVLQADTVSFEPVLPTAKQEAIESLQMGVLDKVFLRFPTVFWDPDVDWIEYIPDSPDEWAEWVSFARPTGQPVLLGFTAADFARRMEAASDAEIVASAMTTLRTIYGPDIPDPIGYQITRWAADPFALGSYSFNSLGAHPRMRDALAAPAGRVFFAGEATEREFFGTVHGAYLSGVRAANDVLAV